jgi:predicted dehydrogenase
MALRCGVIGLGRGRAFAEAFAGNEDCELAAVCDPDPRALTGHEGPGAHTELGAFLDEGLDVVAVASPGPVHARQTLDALGRGAHVICETPPVYSLDEAKEVVRAVSRTGLSYMLAENYIWQGWCVSLERMAGEGRFGEIVYAEGDYTHDCRGLMLRDDGGFVPQGEREGRPGARPTWRATHLPPLLYCSHTLGPLLHLMQDRVVSAVGLAVRGKGMPGVVETDLESGLLRTEKGAVIRLTNGFTLAHPMSLFYNLVGTMGAAKVLRAAGDTGLWFSDTGECAGRWQELPASAWSRPDGLDDTKAMVDDFVRSIVAAARPPLDVHRSMDVALPGLVAHESAAAGGAAMDVPDSRAWA